MVKEVNLLLSLLTGGRGDREIQESVRHFLKIELLNDRLLRVNGPALLGRLITARQRLVTAESAMVARDAVFAQRRNILKSTLAICEYTVECALSLCQQIAKDRNAIEHHADQREMAADMLLSYAFSFETIDVKPYSITLKYAASEFRRAAQMLQEQEYETAFKILLISESSFVLRNVRTDLERVLFRLSRIVHLNHSHGLPAPRPEELERLTAAGKIIASLEDIDMEDFDAGEVEMLIDKVIEAYRKKRYVVAYEELKEAVKRL